jgi:hypothetical protein
LYRGRFLLDAIWTHATYFRALSDRGIVVNVQLAINACLFVQFVANNWKDNNGNNRVLDNLPVLDPAGAPVVAGKQFTVFKTIYACDLATDIHPNAPAMTAGGPWALWLGTPQMQMKLLLPSAAH